MKNFLVATLIGLFSNIVNAQVDSATHYFGLAKKAFSEKKYLLSERLYSKGLKFDPTNIDAQLDLASAYIEMKKFGNANLQYKAIYAVQPNNTVVIEKLANLNFMSRNWKEATEFAKLCVDKKIGIKMHYILAKSHFELENYIESSKYLETASKEDPNNAEIPYTMANIWLEMHQPKRAIDMYNIAISLDPSKTNWYYELGGLYNDQGDSKNAISNYELALGKGMETDLGFSTTLGLAYINSGQDAKGVAFLEKVVAKKPMDKTIYNEIGYAFYDNKKYEQAIEWWDRILQIDKQDAKALYMIGIAFRKNGNEDKGNRLCDAAIALDPKLASLKKQMMSPQGMGL